MSRRRAQKRRVVAEINVVPYIDVMLVLVVVFMVTAPMINRGVEIDLPQAPAEPLTDTPPDEMLIVQIDADGRFYLNLAEDPRQPLDEAMLLQMARSFIAATPTMPVLVRGDHRARYGAVVSGMALLKEAGADKVGLSTRQPDGAVADGAEP